MAKVTAEDFKDLISTMSNLTQKIAIQNDVLNNGPTSADFQSLTNALVSKLTDATDSTDTQTNSTNSNTKSLDENTKTTKSLGSKLTSLGNKLEKFVSSLNKTQKDFGVSIAGAAKLQVSALTSSIKSFIDSFKSINFTQILSGAKNVGGILLNTAKEMLGGNADAFAAGIDKIGEELTKPLAGPAPTQPIRPEEAMEAMRVYQNEFGIINKQFGEELAKDARNRGLSVEQLVQARRVFATTAMGDLNKVAGIQTRFFDQFTAKGMTPKIALEAIIKYSELIARNGTRFADSFARAAADAKKIGVDLSRVDQIGDNIIDDFEGFLEKSAELGAMGFNLDTMRLAQIAETGSTADLFNELRSQLAKTGKDLTNLTRSQRLGLEGLGINMTEILRMAGVTPGGETGEVDTGEQTNNLLAQLLVLLAFGGPLLNTMGSVLNGITNGLGSSGAIVKELGKILTALGPAALSATLVTIITAAIIGVFQGLRGKNLQNKIDEANTDISSAIENKDLEKLRTAQQRRFQATELQNNLYTRDFNELATLRRNNETTRKMLEQEVAETAALGGKSDSYIQRLLEQDFGIPRTPFTFSTMGPSIQGPTIRSGPVNRADGGLITGPGTKKSDSIPARLSNGEYVINADAVSKLGVDFLDTLNNVPKFAEGGLVGSVNKILQSRGLTNLISGMEKLSSFGQKFTQSVESLINRSGFLNKLDSLKNLDIGGKINNKINEVFSNISGTRFGGILGGSLKDRITGMVSKIPNIGDILGGSLKDRAMGMASSIPGIGGLLGGGSLKDRAMGMASSIPGIGGLLGGGSLKDRAMGMVSRIPGVQSIMQKIPGIGGIASSLMRGGGVGGVAKSLASAGAGKLVGGALGSLIPIPGVGTMLGSALGGVIGRGIGRLFGRRRKAAPAIPKTPTITANQMAAFSPQLAQLQMQQSAFVPQIPPIDTRGIEQKLNNFIAALNNIQIVMDGAKLGKVLVNVSDSANTVGVFRPTTRATL